MPANYDNTASFYDFLSRLVFGKAQVYAQLYLLPYIKADNKVLIVGGGTGWILEEISKRYPSGLEITYIEVSEPMMALSKKRNTGSNKIEFIQKPIEEVDLSPSYDVVINAFLFDNFSQATAAKVFNQLNNALNKGGRWLFTDFQLSGKWWQKPLLKMMYLFFSIIGHMETRNLPDTNSYFEEHGYTKIAEKFFFGNFITSVAYQKT